MMTPHYAQIDADGLVLQSWAEGNEPALPECATVVPFSAWIEPFKVYWDALNEKWSPRPECAWEEFAGGIRIAAPDGSIVSVIDTEGDYTMGELSPDAENLVEISLPDPGHYLIDVQPTEGYMPLRLVIEVPE